MYAKKNAKYTCNIGIEIDRDGAEVLFNNTSPLSLPCETTEQSMNLSILFLESNSL
ncbi:MAG: hypothetical protein CM15mP59_2960 [Flavobacteriaceae bacterium]|nr:MAG: hypothetical protein CM15mP59_2960 [Flavobacteriaceae bacterium]